MKKSLFIVFLIFTYGGLAQAKDTFFPILVDSLSKNAHAMLQYYNTDITLSKDGKLTRNVHVAITVLNKAGKDLADLRLVYDEGDKVSIDAVSGYSPLGTKMKDINKKLVKDESIFDGVSVINDSRIKKVDIVGTKYPYTIVYEYEVVEDGYISIENWTPISDWGMSAREAKLTITAPDDTYFREKQLTNYFHRSQQNTEDGYSVSYTLSGFKAKKWEPFAPPYYKAFPSVIIAPTHFKYKGTEGDLSDWKNMGLWSYELNKERDELPEETVAKIQALTQSLSTDREKVKAVYEYMQSRTRYVSIQLGIGGFQPMLAADVDEFGYGDCKALSNYTKALLNAAGIKAYYTIAGMGETSKIRYPEFCSMGQGNHAILTVPLSTDTLFLECTSQTIPFGYVGADNANRLACIVTEDGGKLVNTPRYLPSDNHRIRNIQLDVNEQGSVKCTEKQTLGCWQYDNTIAPLMLMSADEQRKRILKRLDVSNLKLGDYEIEEKRGLKPQGILSLDYAALKYAKLVGNRMIIKMDPNVDSFTKLPNEERTMDIHREVGFMDVDSVYINYPDGYSVEFMPETFSKKSDFGTYENAIIEVEPNKLLFVRKLVVNEGVWDKEKYPEMVSFYNLVAEKDNQQVVLIKN